MRFNAPPIAVSQLVELLKDVAEDNFSQVAVRGEIANISTPASGHWYFSLKDDKAQLQVVMFRPQNRLVKFRPEKGMEVIVSGRMSVYTQRGGLQLIGQHMEPCGVGGLQIAFEQLKEKLEAEGLFAQARKAPLPAFPTTIGVVTSATGAALHDILTVLRRRAAGVRVILRSSLVQGESAANDIARAIDELNRHGEADVLIIGRGGGSLEDLWAFNEEAVVRAIARSSLPIISAVGHEVDTTLADYAADLRAPTPSAAAELVVKHRLELEGHVDHLIEKLTGRLQHHLETQRQRLNALASRLPTPQQKLATATIQQQNLVDRLLHVGGRLGQRQSESLSMLCARLHSLSPLSTLSRGYSIAFKNGVAVTEADTLAEGEQLALQFKRGKAHVKVLEVLPCAK